MSDVEEKIKKMSNFVYLYSLKSNSVILIDKDTKRLKFVEGSHDHPVMTIEDLETIVRLAKTLLE